MHIALCLPNLNGGGAERTTVQIANGLQKRGHTVDLVLLQKIGPYINEIQPDVRVIDLKVNRARYSIFPLYKYIKKERPDVMMSTLLNVPLILANLLTGKKTKTVISERSLFSSIRNDTKTLSERTSFNLSSLLYNQADKLIAVSQSAGDDLISKNVIAENKVRVIYNPVISDMVFQLQNESTRHEWMIDKKNRIILAVGRLSPEKDYPLLLSAFSKLEDNSLQLIILGEGNERPKLEALAKELKIEDRVSMPGFVNNPYSYMSKADVFVLSSKYEGLPGVLIQALACGATCVSTDCPGGSAEILDNGKYGYLTPVGDADSLAATMKKALEFPISKDILKSRGKFFSEESSLDAYENLIYEVKNAK